MDSQGIKQAPQYVEIMIILNRPRRPTLLYYKKGTKPIVTILQNGGTQAQIQTNLK
jgi:hypothetical protein